ncbi:methyltransferase domain-containing protein [candidate division FCPU426 bacterium]|nr:methyltransferase domain-containing protein [candidate division FCPU426 bacterium]
MSGWVFKTDLQKHTAAAGWVALAGLCQVFAPDSWLSALLVGGGIGVLAFLAPAWALVLFGFVLPFEQPRELWGWGTVYTGEMALAASLPGLVWQVAARRAWRQSGALTAAWWLPFTLLLVFSVFFRLSPITSKGALRWLEFILVFIISVHVLRRGREAERVLWALLLAALVSALWGIGQTRGLFALHPAALQIMTSQGETVRAAAAFGPNTLAVFLGMLLPFAAATALFHPSGFLRMTGLLAVLVLATAMGLTFSLTGLLTVAAAAIILLFRAARYSPRFTVWLITLAAAGFVTLMLCQPNFIQSGFWETKLASFQDRLEYMAVSGQLFMTSPWIGIGPGWYRFLAPALGSSDVNPIGFITHPHSLWLTVLVETGLAGFIALVWAGMQLGRSLLEKASRLQSGWPSAAGWSLIAGLSGWIAANAVEHCLIHDRGMHAALFMAAAWVMVKRPSRPPRPERARCFDGLWRQKGASGLNVHGGRLVADGKTRPAGAWHVREAEERKSGRRPFYALVSQALQGRKQPRLLEMGCGPALDAIILGRLHKVETHALDRSAQALRLAALAARRLRSPLILHQADARATGLADAYYDVIFSQGLIEHFPDPQPVWQEMTRLLKPGGCVVVDVPQACNPYSLIKWGHRWLGDWPWGWETQYTVQGLRSAAVIHGLHFTEARGYGYRGGRWDITDWLRKKIRPHMPGWWQQLEDRWGAYWMMNLVAMFQKTSKTH